MSHAAEQSEALAKPAMENQPANAALVPSRGYDSAVLALRRGVEEKIAKANRLDGKNRVREAFITRCEAAALKLAAEYLAGES